MPTGFFLCKGIFRQMALRGLSFSYNGKANLEPNTGALPNRWDTAVTHGGSWQLPPHVATKCHQPPSYPGPPFPHKC